MNAVRLSLLACILTLLNMTLIPTGGLAAAGEQKAGIRVLVSTFPIYQLTRNITTGSERVQVELMIPAQMGCPHDYALTPQDMRKLAEAQVFVVNGLGLEEFLGQPLKTANPTLQVVDSSAGITEVLHYGDEDGEEEEHHHGHGHDAHGRGHDHHHDHGHDHHHDHGHDHDGHGHVHHAGPNPHLFASPRMAALQVANIARALTTLAPEEGELFNRNAQAYVQKLEALDAAFRQLGKRLANTRIVTQHGVFDYLARDMGLEIVAVIASHPGQEPSAAEVLELVQTIREKKAGALFTEPQYPDAMGKTLARESGIAIAVLDPVANGPEEAGLDYYEKTMRTNLQTLADTLGVR